MLSFNVNGTIYNYTDTCKLYNLSAQMLYALDIYVMTDNIDAENWLLSGAPKIEIEIDRHEIGLDAFDGVKFELAQDAPGESFSNPFTYKRVTREGLDDNAYIQKLPSHNAIAQESVLMFGGSTDSLVGEKWGKTRDVAPLYPPVPAAAPPELSPEEQIRWVAENTFDADVFYDERSDWYINMGTRSDFLTLNLNVLPSTNLAELDLYMRDIIIIVEPSQHSRLKKNYMYYDIDNEPPRTEITGVTY